MGGVGRRPAAAGLLSLYVCRRVGGSSSGKWSAAHSVALYRIM